MGNSCEGYPGSRSFVYVRKVCAPRKLNLAKVDPWQAAPVTFARLSSCRLHHAKHYRHRGSNLRVGVFVRVFARHIDDLILHRRIEAAERRDGKLDTGA